jgi:hypothetical protein
MRYVVATLGVIAVAIGTIWLAFGMGYANTRNLICLDDCPAFESGPNQFWALLGAAVLALGMLAVFRLASVPRR